MSARFWQDIYQWFADNVATNIRGVRGKMESLNGAELTRKILNHDQGGIKKLLEITNYKETEWFELKAAILPQFSINALGKKEFQCDLNSNQTDYAFDIVRAIIALANTSGGAVVIGIDDDCKAVGLEPSDKSDKLVQGEDSFARDVLDPLLKPENRTWSCYKEKYLLSDSTLYRMLEYKFMDYDDKRVLAIIVDPVPVGESLVLIEEQNAKREVLLTREIGDIGKNTTIFKTSEIMSYTRNRKVVNEKYIQLYSRFISLIEEQSNLTKREKAKQTPKNSVLKTISDESDYPPHVEVFIGREEELGALNDNDKVIFITGLGGQGKSSLASWYISTYIGYENTSCWDWRDFKEEDQRFHSKLISVIRKLDSSYQEKILHDCETSLLIDVFFKALGNKRVTFVFDNIDKYINLEDFHPRFGIDQFIDQAITRNHNAKFIFTCRPFVKIARVGFLQISLSGLSYEDTLALFKAHKVPYDEATLNKVCAEINDITKGHPLWMNLIAMQARKGIDYLYEFINSFADKTNYDERTITAVLSENTLQILWDTINQNQQTILKCLSEAVRPESMDSLESILSNSMSYNKLSKAVSTLQGLYLIEVRKYSNQPDLFELHPLVKAFLKNKFSKEEREEIVTILAVHYNSFICILRQKPAVQQTHDFYDKCIASIEININHRRFEKAIEELTDTMPHLIREGFVHDFIRVGTQLFDSLGWKDSFANHGSLLIPIFDLLIKQLTHCGQYGKAQRYFELYTREVESNDMLIHLLKCYYFWFIGEADQAIYHGSQCELFLDQKGIDKWHELHGYKALALRDSRKIENIHEALLYFLRQEDPDDIIRFPKQEYPGEYYGNIGRCYHFLHDFDRSLDFYIVSFITLVESKSSIADMNIGYACQWIAEILIEKKDMINASFFIKLGRIKSELYPKRLHEIDKACSKILINREVEQHIDTMTEYEVLDKCMQIANQSRRDKAKPKLEITETGSYVEYQD